MWSAVMFAPSSVRSRFSSKIFRLYGNWPDPSTASSRKIWYESGPTCSVCLESKLFTLMSTPSRSQLILTSRYHGASRTGGPFSRTLAPTDGRLSGAHTAFDGHQALPWTDLD